MPKVPVTYLGPLSRFQKKETENKYDLCIILSGPEPQRTIFEKIILKDLHKVQGKIFLVRGLPGQTLLDERNNSSIEMKNHLPADELSKLIQQSKIIISRCGYSTVMDLVKLQQKAILVPTPGQTEQEYLGAYLQDQKLFFCVAQKNFSLTEVLSEATDFEFNPSSVGTADYETVVQNFVASLTN